MKLGVNFLYILVSVLIIIGIVGVFLIGGKDNGSDVGFLANLSNLSKNSLNNFKKNDTQNMSEINRLPVYAGQFYSENSGQLKSEIKKYLDKSSSISQNGKVRILIVPHAGYEYSGQTAAWGFGQLSGQKYSKVILLGASHTAYFDHAAVYGKGSWETPLGKVEIDEDLALALADEKLIKNDTSPHEKEHSLEVELPFLQTVLPSFKIVPILVSNTSEELKDELAFRIAQNFDDETLLVISTDLSHYPTGEAAEKVDSQTIEVILTGKNDLFEKRIIEIENQNYEGVDTAACGQKAIAIVLKVAEYLRLKDLVKISYSHSGQITGDNSRVVGYGAVGVWSEEKPDVFSKEFEKEALRIARETLEGYLRGDKENRFPISSNTRFGNDTKENEDDTNGMRKDTKENEDDTENDTVKMLFEKKLGAFVTLKNKGQLRGCLGEFEPQKNLLEVIKDRTIAVVSEDPRFEPVTKEELPDIKIEISVLTPMRKISDWRKIKLGEQGVTIVKGNNGGTFLPQVATDTGWSLEEFLGQLCSQKAGLAWDCYKDLETQIYVYEAKVMEEGE